MGLNDRDYYRGDQPGFRLTAPTTAVGLLITVNVAVAVVDMFFMNNALRHLLAADPVMLERPWMAWQLLTAGFAHDGFLHIFFNMLMLWFFGPPVEQRYGKAEFLRIYLLIVVLANLVFVIWEYSSAVSAGLKVDELIPVLGASGAVLGIFTLFIAHAPHARIHLWGVLPVPAWLVGVFYLANNLLLMRQDLQTGGVTVSWQVHLAGAGLAYLYFRGNRRLGNMLPASWSWRSVSSMFKRRPKLRLHEPRERESNLELRVDQILAKINSHGMDSLTAAERRTLEEESRRARQRRS